MTHYCFDIDGTICTITELDYAEAQPIPEAIDALRSLHELGHTITLFTARGSVTAIDWRAITEVQLKDGAFRTIS